MAAFSTLIGAAGAAATAVGVGAQVFGMVRAQKGEKRAEQIRKAQMDLESQRERRSVVRQANVARAAALSNATAQGAQDGSGLAGGQAQISGQAGTAISATNQNQQLGGQMFSANRMISSGNTMSSIGSGIQSLGGALVQNSQTIGRLGNYALGIRN